jgi:hypothetical protein
MSQLQLQLGLTYFELVAGVPRISPVDTESGTGSSAGFDRSHRTLEMSRVKTSNELSGHRCQTG